MGRDDFEEDNAIVVEHESLDGLGIRIMERANDVEVDGGEIGELFVYQSPPQAGVFAFVGSHPRQAFDLAVGESQCGGSVDFGEIGVESIRDPSKHVVERNRSVVKLSPGRKIFGFDVRRWRRENRVPMDLVGFTSGIEDRSGIGGDLKSARDRPNLHRFGDAQNRLGAGVGLDPMLPPRGGVGISFLKDGNGAADGLDDPHIRCRSAFEVDGVGGAARK